VIAHPPDEAATETATELAAIAGAKTREVAELADPNLGLLEGLTVDDFAERYPTRGRQWQEDILSISPPEGEDIHAARVRVFRAIAGVLKRARSEETAIVLHPIALGLLRCYFCQRPASAMWKLLEKRPAVERYAMSRQVIRQLAEVPMLETAG
jgi:broad specificity phosphatase PhoE